MAHNHVITEDDFGIILLYYPGGTTNRPTINYGIARSHDWNGGATNCFAAAKWCNVETAKNVFNWTNIDQFVNTALADGKTPLLTIDGTPSWAVSSPLGNGCYRDLLGNLIPASSTCPDDINDFGDWCTALANRYGSTVMYEVWNEPNFIVGGVAGAGYWVSTASEMAQMMRVAYQAIKSVSPDAIVCSPSCVGGVGRLNNMLTASDGAGGQGKDWFDVLGYHFYNTPNSSVSVVDSISIAASIRSVLRSVGRECEIWNTESGVSDGGLSAVDQATRELYIRKHFTLRIALGIYKNIFYAYDSSTMGLKIPANTGTTYDITSAYSDLLFELNGKRLVYSLIYHNNIGEVSVRLMFDDGSVFET